MNALYEICEIEHSICFPVASGGEICGGLASIDLMLTRVINERVYGAPTRVNHRTMTDTVRSEIAGNVDLAQSKRMSNATVF